VSAKMNDIRTLVLISLLGVGVSWVYDTPGAVYDSLTTRFADYSAAQNRVLYSVYNWPNVFMAVLSGFMIDSWLGLRRSTTLYAVLVFIGQLLFAIAVQTKTYWIAVLGRTILGFGGDSLKVAQNTWIATHSQTRNISFTFGWVLGISRCASAISFVATPNLAYLSVTMAIWVGFGMTALSLGASVWLFATSNPDYPRMANCMGLCHRFRDELVHMQSILRSFPAQVWLQFATCVFFHVGILLLYQLVSDILQITGDGMSERSASSLVSVPLFISLIGTGIAGYAIDRFGKALWSTGAACVLLILSHVLLVAYVFAWTDTPLVTCIVALVFVGLSFSLATAAIWPIVPSLVVKDHLAIAYGTMISIENLGLAGFPLIISAVQDAPAVEMSAWKYAVPLLILSGNALVALVTVAIQAVIGHRLNLPAALRMIPVVPELDTDGDAHPLSVRLHNEAVTSCSPHSG
jgi:MFS family permease